MTNLRVHGSNAGPILSRLDIEPPDGIPLERTPSNGAYSGPLRVRHVPAGLFGEDLSGKPKVYVFHPSMKSRDVPAPKGECRRGHPRTPENTRPHHSGRGVKCLVCERIGGKKHRDKRRKERDALRAGGKPADRSGGGRGKGWRRGQG